MTDMFIPKKERIIIALEAIIYVLLIILASYFTICGNMFIRMVPLLYLLGILGVIMFDKPIVTIILSTISVITFGSLIEYDINSSIMLFALYSALMTFLGEVTGHILHVLYENFKLRKFIKHYHKIIYVVVLVVCVTIPVFLNNVVNSNTISYIFAKKEVEKYISENYIYSEYYIENIEYVPSYKGGMYQFYTVIDNVEVELNYTHDEKVADVNMNTRKEKLNKIANAEINILLRENNLTNLDVVCRYDYSKIATVPDIIKMSVLDVDSSEIDDVLSFLTCLKGWGKYTLIERIDVIVDELNVSINKEDLEKKEINAEYILNGMKHETLSSKEDM